MKKSNLKCTSKIIKTGILGILVVLFSLSASAQTQILNMPDHDSEPYYFGLSFALNYSTFRNTPTKSFAEHDTFLRVQSNWRPGFNVGIMGNLRLSSFIDLRFIPALVFAEKAIDVWYPGSADPVQNSIESIYMQLPLQLKFKSDRINNFRFYGLAGGVFDYDLASNARSRTVEWLKVKPIDVGAELGIGFEFFYPNFIFSPEIKLSQGFLNEHFSDPDIPLSNTIDRLSTRMIVISIHIEG